MGSKLNKLPPVLFMSALAWLQREENEYEIDTWKIADVLPPQTSSEKLCGENETPVQTGLDS